MREFDFEEAKKYHSAAKVAWLKENYKYAISEAVFVEIMRERFKPISGAKHKAKVYSPCALRNKYHYLKKNYGFFGAKK